MSIEQCEAAYRDMPPAERPIAAAYAELVPATVLIELARLEDAKLGNDVVWKCVLWVTLILGCLFLLLSAAAAQESNGTLYMVSAYTNNSLYTVNTGSGTATLVGGTGTSAPSGAGLLLGWHALHGRRLHRQPVHREHRLRDCDPGGRHGNQRPQRAGLLLGRHALHGRRLKQQAVHREHRLRDCDPGGRHGNRPARWAGLLLGRHALHGRRLHQ